MDKQSRIKVIILGTIIILLFAAIIVGHIRHDVTLRNSLKIEASEVPLGNISLEE